MLKSICFLLVLSISFVHGQQLCSSRFDQNITGFCGSTATCEGSALNSEVCGQRACCINNTTIPSNSTCFNQTIFTEAYGTRRGAYLGRILNYAISQAGICQNCRAKAAFLAIASTMTEGFLYDEAFGNDASFSNDDHRFGNNATGDGSRYRRRGFFGIKGKTMYQKFQSIHSQYQIYDNPQSAANPIISANIAALLWRNPTLQLTNAVPLTNHADGTFYGLSMLWYKLTGGDENLAAVAYKYSFFLRMLECGGSLYPGQGDRCQMNGNLTGYCVPMCIQGMEDIGDVCGCGGNVSLTSCPDSPGHIRCCTDPCGQELKMDLGLVLDSSWSISAPNYELLRSFVKSLLNKVNVGRNKTHVGIINFSTSSEILTYLNADYSLSEKQLIVDRARFLNQGTDTAAALQQANTVFASNRGLRGVEEGVVHVIFVITDGASVDEQATIAAASVLKQKGIHMISVGVGNNLRLSELYAVCTRPINENYFPIDDYAALNSRLNQFVSKSCSQTIIIPPNTTVTAEVTGGKYKFFQLDVSERGSQVLAKAKLIVGDVKIFYSFTSRNPKDPSEFLNVATKKDESKTEQFRFNPISFFSSNELMESSERQSNINKAGELYTWIVINKPNNAQNFDSVYVGVKGTAENNKFELKLEDCTVVSCQSSGAFRVRLSFLVVLLCVFLSIRSS